MSHGSFLWGTLRIIRIESRLTGIQSKSDALRCTMVTEALTALHIIAITPALQREMTGKITPNTLNLPLLPQQQKQFTKCLFAGEEPQSSLYSHRFRVQLVS